MNPHTNYDGGGRDGEDLYEEHRENIERVAASYVEGYDLSVICESKMLRVWRFDYAPQILRYLSDGKEADWLMAIPPGFNGSIPWSEEGQRFGGYNVDDHRLSNGWIIRIGYHAP